MPELPEVETVRQTLKNYILNKKIIHVSVFYDKMIINQSPRGFSSSIEGKAIEDISRIGKYLLFRFQEMTLVSHLRMEGKYFIKPVDEPRQKHEHVIFAFEDGSSLRYHDTRKFGTMEIVPRFQENFAKGLSDIGPEPFDSLFTSTYLYSKISNSSRPIKTALLDQKVVSGLGNIYVDEVLFLSKINPATACMNITESECQAIALNSAKVLNKAIELGGTTIRSYTSSLGVTGRFQNELFVHMRKNEPCKICRTQIQKTKVGGRGTYFCPNCQK